MAPLDLLGRLLLLVLRLLHDEGYGFVKAVIALLWALSNLENAFIDESQLFIDCLLRLILLRESSIQVPLVLHTQRVLREFLLRFGVCRRGPVLLILRQELLYGLDQQLFLFRSRLLVRGCKGAEI